MTFRDTNVLKKWLLGATVIIGGVAALFIDFAAFMGGYADKRFVLTLLISAFFFLPSVQPWCGLKIGYAIWVIGIGSGLLIAGFSMPALAESGLYLFFPVVVFSLASSVARQGLDSQRQAVRLLLLAMMAYAALTPTVYLFAISDGVQSLDDYLPWGFVNIRYWGHAGTWLLPLLPLAHIVYHGQYQAVWKLFVALAAGIWWWLVFLSAARGTFLSISVAVVFLLIVFGRASLPWFRGLVAQCSIGVLTWLLLSVLVPYAFIEAPDMRSVGTDTSGRVRLWQEAWMMSLDNFPFGMGVQSWLTHLPLTESYEAGKKLGHPHNMYLMWAAEFGWLAVFGLVIIGASILFKLIAIRESVRRYRFDSDKVMLLAGLTGSVCAAMIHAGASAVFMAPSSMLLGLIILALFLSMLWNCSPSATGSRSGARGYGVCVFFLIPVILLWNYSTYMYYWEMREDHAFYAEEVSEGTLPRFWFHGNFPRPPEKMLNSRE